MQTVVCYTGEHPVEYGKYNSLVARLVAHSEVGSSFETDNKSHVTIKRRSKNTTIKP